jgi:uncharacterized protein (TIGR00369 family)
MERARVVPPSLVEPVTSPASIPTLTTTAIHRLDKIAILSLVVSDLPIWKEPPRGNYPDLRIFQLPPAGFDLAMRRGKFPRAPLFYLVGTWITYADQERTVWEQPASGWFLSSQGVVPGGFLAVLADMALGSIASRNVRRMFSTSEMSFNFVRTATERSRTLIAEGRFVSGTGRLALSEATIKDAAGAVIAHSTCRNVLSDTGTAGDPVHSEDAGALSAFVDSLPDAEPVDTTTPHPYLRPVVGEVLARQVWERATGREVLEGQIAGTVPMPPIHHLTGIRPTAVGDGSAEFAMPASAWLTSGFRSVLGGFIAFLGYSALASAVQTTTEPGMAHVPVDLKINLIRPVFADPELRDLTASGRVIHRGRTLSVADAEVRGVDGKLVAVARGTSMLLPDQAAGSIT